MPVSMRPYRVTLLCAWAVTANAPDAARASKDFFTFIFSVSFNELRKPIKPGGTASRVLPGTAQACERSEYLKIRIDAVQPGFSNNIDAISPAVASAMAR